MVRDGPLVNLSGGGRSTKKNMPRKGKFNEKNHARQEPITPINPKRYSCYGLKKNSYKEFDDEKEFPRLENSPPPPPHNFSNGPLGCPTSILLRYVLSVTVCGAVVLQVMDQKTHPLSQ